MIVAVVVFLSSTGPVATSAGRQTFRTDAECRAFLAASDPLLRQQLAIHSAVHGAPLQMVTVCVDVGTSA